MLSFRKRRNRRSRSRAGTENYDYWDFDGHNYRFGPQRGMGYGDDTHRHYGWDFRPDYVAGREAWDRIDFGSDEGRSDYGFHSRRRGRHSGIAPKGYRRSDERITEEICDRLTEHPEINPSEVEIDVAEGHVTLRGEVEERWEKRLCEDICYSVIGVQDVRNEIRVRGTRRAETTEKRKAA